MKGIVFDIQKFALHDGPGIRTVLFLKGCPFKCVWCCNPESIDPNPQLAYEENKCNQCTKCVNVCGADALKMEDGKLVVDFDKCTVCGNCVSECPKSAFKIYGYEADSDALIEEVMKDVDYYKNSGGGLTLSGGDPLYQFDFAYELFSKAKAKGLNTCLESEGFGEKAQFEKIIPLVDYFYFDYKITNPADHERYTGVANKIVLENLAVLGEHCSKITLRCVLIPGINDNDDHFKAIAALSQKYPTISGVEVMAYHDYGSAKNTQIGKPIYPIESKAVKPEVAEKWVNRIIEFGGKNVKRG